MPSRPLSRSGSGVLMSLRLNPRHLPSTYGVPRYAKISPSIVVSVISTQPWWVMPDRRTRL